MPLIMRASAQSGGGDNNMKRLLKYLVTHFIFFGCLYLWIFHDVEGAQNVALVFAWLFFSGSLFVFSGDIRKAMVDKGRSVPMWFNTAIDLTIAVAFVWNGAIMTGVFYLIHMILGEGGWEMETKRRKEGSEAKAND